jgi:trimethylamine---corrinoid protein Co-methyltransferase
LALSDSNSYEQWADEGSFDMQQRAHLRWKQMLLDYEPPPMDRAVDEALLAFVAKKKRSMEDAWY